MKKQIAITGLLIFFLAQFGRVINFSLCTISSWEQTGTLACDCEKQLMAGIRTDLPLTDHSPEHISAAIPTEELFHRANFTITIQHPTAVFSKWPSAVTEMLYFTAGRKMFRPPLHLA